jgi:hypothetical protein
MEEARPLLDVFDTIPKDHSQLAAWRESNRTSMTQAGHYRHLVMWRTINLLGMFERLERARYLLLRSPPATRSRTTRLDRADWTQYHFWVFTACLPAITDCCLLLTANVYQLGIPPRFCTFDLVTSHDWLKGTGTSRALKSLRKGLEDHTQRRHRYLHRGEAPDIGELTDPEWLMDLRQLTFLHSVGEGSVDKRLLTGAWRVTLRELRPVLGAAESSALDGTEGVLKVLLPQFERRAQLLGQMLRK